MRPARFAAPTHGIHRADDGNGPRLANRAGLYSCERAIPGQSTLSSCRPRIWSRLEHPEDRYKGDHENERAGVNRFLCGRGGRSIYRPHLWCGAEMEEGAIARAPRVTDIHRGNYYVTVSGASHRRSSPAATLAERRHAYAESKRAGDCDCHQVPRFLEEVCSGIAAVLLPSSSGSRQTASAVLGRLARSQPLQEAVRSRRGPSGRSSARATGTAW